jgi:uncharacterized protein YjdB
LRVYRKDHPVAFNICYNVWQAGIWRGEVCDGTVAGESGLRIEGLAVRLFNAPGWSVCYQVHVADVGWMAAVCDWTATGQPASGRAVQAVRVWVQPQ